MKIVVTGSLGHISKPLAEKLLSRGHAVTIISSKAERLHEIQKLGATAAIGSLHDVDFLTKTFHGADIVYLMEPPFNFFDHSIDPVKYWLDIAHAYVQAIEKSGVTKIVHLSSIGAHTDQGIGMLATHHLVENVFKTLPGNVIIKTMRPVGFYYNMFAFIPSIKHAGAIFQNYGGDKKEPWVSTIDIANTIAEEIETPFDHRSVQYIASDEVSPDEVAQILGNAIGKNDLKWVIIPNEQFINNLISAGFSKQIAEGFAAMNAARTTGILYEDYYRNKPVLGKTKWTTFAKEFAAVYNG